MTDRELLELAAKAAGIKIDKSPFNGGGDKNDGFDAMGNVVLDWHNMKTWNPLEDDGDALRLAVKLRMEIDICRTGIAVRTSAGHKILVDFSDQPNDYAATRRAIVRAAAELGKQSGEK